MRCLEDTFQEDEIGNVEVPNGDTAFSCFLYYFNEFSSSTVSFDHHMQARIDSIRFFWLNHFSEDKFARSHKVRS